MTTLLAELQKRDLIHDVSHFQELEAILEKGPITYYCGFDPTADSLHIGNMVPLMMLRHFQRKGHKPLALIGSTTGMIGDPSGKSEERKLITKEQVEINALGIEKDIAIFLHKDGVNGYKLVRNDSWLGTINYVDFLRDIGKHFSVNAMIAKESVKARLESREQGISYTEFSYMLLQAYDFYHLNTYENCLLQMGGSDQWGNITAGIELIRRKSRNQDRQAYGITFPLITTSTGQKFGKTEKGTIWLKKEKTSPYEFYQYWFNTADADVEPYLKIFTELSEEEILSLVALTQKQPEERAGQKTLARIITTLVHGKNESDKAESASLVLFGGSMQGLDSSTLLAIFSDVPSTKLSANRLGTEIALQELLLETKLAQSKGAARRLIDGGGIYLNNERVSNSSETISRERFVDGRVLVLRTGKKNYHLALITD